MNRASKQHAYTRIATNTTFEEAAAAEARDAAMQPPKERLQEAVELILRVYGVTQAQLNNRVKKMHLKLISYS